MRSRTLSDVNAGLRRRSAGALLCLTMAGCAGPQAYRDGKELVQQGEVIAALARFDEALHHDPRNAQYRKAALETRERAVYAWVADADRLLAAGSTEQAIAAYDKVLQIDPENQRAGAALRKQKEQQELKEQKAQNKGAAAPPTRLAREAGAAVLVEPTLSAAYQQPISLTFNGAPLRQIFAAVAQSSDLNFIFDKDVNAEQRASIYLKNSTIEMAIGYLLLTNQLSQQVLNPTTILIYPNTAPKQKDYQEMVVKTFFLANAEAKSVATILKTILKTRDLAIDEKRNMLVMRDSKEAVRLAEKLVALQDIAEPEVMLEVEILEVKRTRLLELGIQWPKSLSLTPVPLLNGSTGAGLTLDDLRRQSSRTLAAGISPVTLNARKEDSDANLLANPRIRARNHEKAKILIGERVPNITSTATSTGFVSESINYVDVGLKLDVEPTIYLNNEVAMKVSLEVSNIVSQIRTQSGSIAYQIGTRTASTVLRLKDGETQVLAGLINDEDRRSGNKVPGLGEMPVVGRLFGSGGSNNEKTEIVLSITPRLIRNIALPDPAQSEFWSGTDSGLRNRGDYGARASSAVPTAAVSIGALPGPGAAAGEPIPGASQAVPERAGGDAAANGGTNGAANGGTNGAANGSIIGSANAAATQGALE